MNVQNNYEISVSLPTLVLRVKTSASTTNSGFPNCQEDTMDSDTISDSEGAVGWSKPSEEYPRTTMETSDEEYVSKKASITRYETKSPAQTTYVPPHLRRTLPEARRRLAVKRKINGRCITNSQSSTSRFNQISHYEDMDDEDNIYDSDDDTEVLTLPVRDYSTRIEFEKRRERIIKAAAEKHRQKKRILAQQAEQSRSPCISNTICITASKPLELYIDIPTWNDDNLKKTRNLVSFADSLIKCIESRGGERFFYEPVARVPSSSPLIRSKTECKDELMDEDSVRVNCSSEGSMMSFRSQCEDDSLPSDSAFNCDENMYCD